MEHCCRCMAYVLAVSNQKGGVGKTTTVVNCAAYAAISGQRVLVVDNDPQGNATSVLAPGVHRQSIYSDAQPITTTIPGLSVIAASPDLLDEERRLAQEGPLILRQRLSPYLAAFDLIVIDCPPNLSRLPANALLAAQGLLIPVQCEYYALEGLSQLLAYVHDLHQDAAAEIALVGILPTMFDTRFVSCRDVIAELRKHFAERVLTAAIPRDVALAVAPSHGRTILDFAPLSPGGIAYLAATKELLDAIR